MRGTYPDGATKQEKGVIRKRAKHVLEFFLIFSMGCQVYLEPPCQTSCLGVPNILGLLAWAFLAGGARYPRMIGMGCQVSRIFRTPMPNTS